MARVEIPKPPTIVRPEPPAEGCNSCRSGCRLCKRWTKNLLQSRMPHTRIKKSDWKPFDKPLADDELTRRVDNELAALWQKNGIHPVEAASDAEFMRRVYLDLTGRIPTVSGSARVLRRYLAESPRTVG